MRQAFTFDPPSHTYRLGEAVLPSVTQLIDGALVSYAMVPPDVLEAARQMGLAVHRATELYDLADLDEASLDPQLRPYLEAYVRFRRETGFEPTAIEEQLYHPGLLYAGTPDRCGRMGGDLVVLDLKKMQVLNNWIGVQTSAYQELIGAHGRRPKRRFGLSLRKDGTYKLHEFTSRDDWPCFMSLLTLFNWKARHGNA